jgi:hypothetical protein
MKRGDFLRSAALAALPVALPVPVPHDARTTQAAGTGRGPSEVIYRNPLATPADVESFRLEGDARMSFPQERLRMENARDPAEGQAANFVYWCPAELPDHIRISWKFWPIRSPGLSILFFAARARGGGSIFDAALAERRGEYGQYHSGDIDALHVSYFRRSNPEERAFSTCNLRKSHGFHLVAQGADPIPAVVDAQPPYEIELLKSGRHVRFAINGLPIFSWRDDGSHGPPLTAGRIGLRQMAPLIAEYADLMVERIEPLVEE